MKLGAVPVIAAVLIVTLATVSLAASADSPQQQIAQLKKQLRQVRLDNADLRDQVDAENGVISDQADTIIRLRTRLANQADALDVITSRGPDGLWAAMRAIWLAFPTQDPSSLCGYDRSSVPGGGDGLTLTSYTFYRWTGC